MNLLRLTSTIILITLFVLVSSFKDSKKLELVSRSLKKYFETGYEGPYLTKVFKEYQLPDLFRPKTPRTFDSYIVCGLCKIIVNLLLVERKLGISRKFLARKVTLLCKGFGIERPRVCAGAVDLNIDIFLYIADNYKNLTSSRVCGMIFQKRKCSKKDNFEWSIALPPEKKQKKSALSGPEGSFRILHLSDFHYDPNYLPKGWAVCGEPMCCQNDQQAPKSPSDECGYWSDYRNADAPWHLIEETIRQVKTQKFDYVYYTGDITSHRIWDTSIKKNTKVISELYSFFKKSFNVPVYPVLGNHEPHPMNVWVSESVKEDKFSPKWLFDLAADFWSELSGENVKETSLKGGYYTVSPRPGFRIIAINSNFGYTFNWWLIFDDFDPYGQLQWLADTLEKAEDNGERVHIVCHIPSGTEDTLSVWGREYSRIVDRFQDTIVGQFTGHTHTDEFNVYYSKSQDKKPIGVAFNGASVTPFTDSNPSYKIFEVNSSTFALKDYEEWTFNLTLANSQAGNELPQWYKLYSFVEAYGVSNLDPVEVDKVVYKLATNRSLLDNYFKFKYRNGDAALIYGCNETCHKSNLCEIATTEFGEDTHCNRFLDLFSQK